MKMRRCGKMTAECEGGNQIKMRREDDSMMGVVINDVEKGEEMRR